MPRYTTIRKLVDTMRAVKSNPETVINTGDVIYLIGKEKGLDYMTTLLEG